MKGKSIIPILLVLIPWFLFLPFLCQLAGMEALSAWLFTHTVKPVYIAFPIILILNVFCDYVCPWDTQELNLWNLRVKVLLVPTYLLMLGLVHIRPEQFALLLILCVLLLAASSAYGLRVLFRAKKNGELTLIAFLLLLVCHFCFVTDIIAAAVLRRTVKS